MSAEAAVQEEKRGRKRSLAEVESKVSEPPSPKRRKLSNGNSEHVAILKNEEQIKDKIDADAFSDIAVAPNSGKSPQSLKPPTMPNAIPSDTVSPVIDLLDSDSPTTNDSATFNSHDNQTDVVANGSKESNDSNNSNGSNGSNHVDLTQMTQVTESNANNPETDVEMADKDDTERTDTERTQRTDHSDALVNALPKLQNSESPPNVPNHSHRCCGASSHFPADSNAISTPVPAPTQSVLTSSIIRPCNDGNSQFDYLTIWTDERCLLHAIPVEGFDEDFNERPARLRALHQMIQDEKWYNSCRVTSRLEQVPSIEDIYGESHDAGYLADLKNQCSRIAEGKWYTATGSDTYLVRRTFDAALVSAGLVIEATKHTFSHVPPLPISPSMSVDYTHSTKTKSRVHKGDKHSANPKEEDDTNTTNNDTNHNNDNSNGHVVREGMDVDDAVDNGVGNGVANGTSKDGKGLENGSADARSQQNGADGAIGAMENGTDHTKSPVIGALNGGDPVLSKQSTEIIEDVDIADVEAKDEDDDGPKYKNKHPKKYAVVLNRPPGHHCDGKKYSGYCFINSTAVAIEKQLNMDTKVETLTNIFCFVLVLDIDVHHGDGTQKIFYPEPSVLTVSLHQYDGHFFPSSGKRTEYGLSKRHQAYGTNVNIPLGKQASDLDVLYALRNMVWHIVEKFQPDIAFYAVGTDGVANDKANNSTIFTPSLYGQVAYELRKYVNLIVVTTEGGYTTDYLARGMSCVLHGLTGQIDPNHYPSEFAKNDILDSTIHTVAASTSDLRRVWDFEQDPDEIKKIFNHAKRLDATPSFDEYIESMYIPGEDGSAGDYDGIYDHEMDDFDDDDFVLSDGAKKKKKKKKKKNRVKKEGDTGPETAEKKKRKKDRTKDKKEKKERRETSAEKRERREERRRRKQEKRERREKRRKRKELKELERRQRSQQNSLGLPDNADGERRDSAIDLTGDSQRDSEYSVTSKNEETSVDEEGSRKRRKHRKHKKHKSKRKRDRGDHSDKEKRHKRKKKRDKSKKERKSKNNVVDSNHSSAPNQPMENVNKQAIQDLVSNLNHHNQSNGVNGHSMKIVPDLSPVAPSDRVAVANPNRNVVEVIDLIEDSPMTHTSNDGHEETEKKEDVVVEAPRPRVSVTELNAVSIAEVSEPPKRRRRRRPRSKSNSKTNTPEAVAVEDRPKVVENETDKKDSDENSCDVNNVKAACLSSMIGDGIHTLAIDQKQEEKDEKDEKGNPSDSDGAGEDGVTSTATSAVIVIDSE